MAGNLVTAASTWRIGYRLPPMTVEYFCTRPGSNVCAAFTKSAFPFSKVLPLSVNLIVGCIFWEVPSCKLFPCLESSYYISYYITTY